MSNLRVLLTPVRVNGPFGRVFIPGVEVGVSPLGSVPARFDQAPAKLEFSCLLVTDIRLSERTAPVGLGSVAGAVTSQAVAPVFAPTAPFEPLSVLTDSFEKEGRRRPRRRIFLRFVDAPTTADMIVLLPDALQVLSGHMEVLVKLSVAGGEQGTEEQNDVLDVPLLPLRQTHAVFQFFDGSGEPLRDLTARFDSAGNEIEATTDAFGEIFLEASDSRSYTFIEALPADERVALVDAAFSRSTSSVA